MKLRRIKQKLGMRKVIAGRSIRVLPLFIISLLMMGVAADLIQHYIVTVDTTPGDVLADPYYTKFQSMAYEDVTNVPFGDVMQNSYVDTIHYLLVLVNPVVEVEMEFNVIGSFSAGIMLECFDASDVIWEEGPTNTRLMGDGYGGEIEIYFRVSATYDAVVGASIGDFDLQFIANEYWDRAFNMEANPVTKSGGVAESWDPVDSGDLVTVLTAFDFGTIVPLTPSVYTGAALVFNNGPHPISYGWTGMPTDVTVVVEYSMDGGTTWVVWIEGVDSPMWESQTVYLRITITADELADYPTGLLVPLDFSRNN